MKRFCKAALYILTFATFAIPALAQNTPKFPALVPTNQDLLIAKNQAETTLNGSINASTLSIVVTSGSVFTAPMAVTIDNEAILVCSISTNTLTVCASGRGFDGTTATTHLNLRPVQSRVIAWQHNQVSAETIALAKNAYKHHTNILEKGALCDGATDDTTAIQTALTAGGHIVFPGGTCIVNPLIVASNSYLEFHPLTVLKAKTGYNDDPGAKRLLNITDVSNVTIAGNGGTVQMIKAEYTAGEQRHGVFITGSSNIRIYDLTSRDTGGDGFYIGASTATAFSSNVSLINCIADNNRRQGLSIVSGKNILILGGEYKNTTGTAPSAGIDIEPDDGTLHKLENINILGVRTASNAGGGIQIVPSQFASVGGNHVSISINGWYSFQDGTINSGAVIGSSTLAARPASATNKIQGQIVIRNSTIYNPWIMGLTTIRWSSAMPDVLLDSVDVINPNRGGLTSVNFLSDFAAGELTNAAASGFVHAAEAVANLVTASTGKIEYKNCKATSTNGGMILGFYLHAANVGSTRVVATVTDPIVRGQTSTGGNVNWNRGDGNVVYTAKPVYAPAANAAADTFIGYDIAPVGTINLTLPKTSELLGVEFPIRNDDVVGVVLTPNAADKFNLFGFAAGQTLTLAPTGQGNQSITLRSVAGNKWEVIGKTSFYPFSPAYVISGYGTVHATDTRSVVIGGSGQTGSDAVSVAWGTGTGLKLNFGYNNAGTFVPTSAIYDSGRHDLKSLQVNAGVLLTKIASGSATWDPPSIVDGAVTAFSMTVTGALSTSICYASFAGIGTSNVLLSAQVSGADTVRVVAENKTGAPLDMTSNTISAMCLIQ